MADAWVYILRCADGSLYTGWSTDVQRRLAVYLLALPAACAAIRRRMSVLQPVYRDPSAQRSMYTQASAIRQRLLETAPRWASGSAGSRTGVACIVRSRTSFQESPSFSSAGRPMISAVATSTTCRTMP